MGKFLICCEHPSNKFFSQFRNCLIYRTPDEFTEKIRFAMENEPLPLTDKEAYSLTWEVWQSVARKNIGILSLADHVGGSFVSGCNRTFP